MLSRAIAPSGAVFVFKDIKKYKAAFGRLVFLYSIFLYTPLSPYPLSPLTQLRPLFSLVLSREQ